MQIPHTKRANLYLDAAKRNSGLSFLFDCSKPVALRCTKLHVVMYSLKLKPKGQ
ncbi:hypothetical protein Lpar_0716 [Legionella parisiensis]|uniref:Uncharacterized protein n=1 Tax=Legionella parisiensis TaxID=45071 RepID=A0A1E5JRG2_9GAMM|nr:hypothetical protein Lpar_0716 [Legionella parisiensis]OEH47109.1 hypothetical protein lpari_01884 [Legionella parisiensis]STX71581.1 Uncharacterised protein [Legionella parisiensis]